MFSITLQRYFLFSDDVDFSFYYDYDLEMKENRKNYFKITNSTLLHNIGGMFIELKNLFNGDKFLGRL